MDDRPVPQAADREDRDNLAPGNHTPDIRWSEASSQVFLDYGRYFIPQRERQIETIRALIPPLARPLRILELGCGEGVLAEALLEGIRDSYVQALDGSALMLQRAAERLARFNGRFRLQHFDLAAQDWRQTEAPYHAIVSSLAVHHLNALQKQQLFVDLCGMLAPGGALVLADLIQPQGHLGQALAAEAWDVAVQARSQALAGDQQPWQFFDREGWNLFRHPDPEIDHPSPLLAQLRWLAEAGFEGVDVYWLQAGHAIYGGRKAAGVRLITVAQARPLRAAILRPGLPFERSIYPGDEHPDTLHLGVFQGEQLVGVATVLHEALPGEHDLGAWRLRGMAVQAAARRSGLGRALILAALDNIAAAGGERLWCNARFSAMPFYQALGFHTLGEPFDVPESGPHYRMQRAVLLSANQGE